MNNETDKSTAADLAKHELERARMELENKGSFTLAQVYASNAIAWIKAAQRKEETGE